MFPIKGARLSSIDFESDEPADKLAHLIKNARARCLITPPVPLHRRSEASGKPFHLEGVTAA